MREDNGIIKDKVTPRKSQKNKEGALKFRKEFSRMIYLKILVDCLCLWRWCWKNGKGWDWLKGCFVVVYFYFSQIIHYCCFLASDRSDSHNAYDFTTTSSKEVWLGKVLRIEDLQRWLCSKALSSLTVHRELLELLNSRVFKI